MRSFSYYQRVFQAYLGRGASQLSFWHGVPAVNSAAFEEGSTAYYMLFAEKAEYAGPFDEQGIPQLDYRGQKGKQYNPIAIAQYGLACWNRWLLGGTKAGDGEEATEWKGKAIKAADWLVANLEANAEGMCVWMHHFDWEYFRLLRAPWYSGLAQGQGLSLLTRTYEATGDERYRQAADSAFATLTAPIDRGGAVCVDDDGRWWIEEYICDPPTHILNGFIWALWGVWDYEQLTGSAAASELVRKSLETLASCLSRFDCGFWSRYDLAPTGLANVASPFYHRLHIVQLDVLFRLTGDDTFRGWRDKWQGYVDNAACRKRAYVQKGLFKLFWY